MIFGGYPYVWKHPNLISFCSTNKTKKKHPNPEGRYCNRPAKNPSDLPGTLKLAACPPLKIGPNPIWGKDRIPNHPLIRGGTRCSFQGGYINHPLIRHRGHYFSPTSPPPGEPPHQPPATTAVSEVPGSRPRRDSVGLSEAPSVESNSPRSNRTASGSAVFSGGFLGGLKGGFFRRFLGGFLHDGKIINYPSHRIHVWYICLHLPYKNQPNAG